MNEVYLSIFFFAVQSLSHVQLFETPWSTPRLPVLNHLPEFAQTHLHWVNDAIQLSHPLLPSSLALNLYQHQGLFQRVSSSHQVAEVLEIQFQHQSFQWIFRTDFLYDWLVWSPSCPRDPLRVFSSTSLKASILQRSAFFMVPTLTSAHDY